MKLKRNLLIRIFNILLMLMIFSNFCINSGIVFAEKKDSGVDEIISAMESTSEPTMETESGLLGTINSVIGLIQVAGSGISILVITIVGIRYILSSPQEKADLKKSAMPIIIGCVLLFGAVNIVAIIEKFSMVFHDA